MKKSADPELDLIKLFGSVSRVRILGFLHAFRGQSFYQREIMFRTGLTLRGVQRELSNLVALGIVKTQKTHNRVYYEVNPDSTFFKPLQDIFSFISAG
jgi:predicted transcriptional regulator